MSSNKFEFIYKSLRLEIEEGVYNDTMILPTEMELCKRFDTSRNTIRRAIQVLNDDGVVYSAKGRGVVILENTNIDKMYFKIGNFQGLKSLSSNKYVKKDTKVQLFKEITVDEILAQKISFIEGERVYKIERTRFLNGKAMMFDTSYFKKSIIKNLTEDIVKGSIYDYIKQKLNLKIVASKSILKIDTACEKDYEYLHLDSNNCVGEMINVVFDDRGRLFEHTVVRYIPNEFALVTFDKQV